MSKRKTHLGDRDIPILKLKLDDKVYPIDVAADLYVTDDLDTELDRNPSLFVWYGVMAEDAQTNFKNLKLKLDEKKDELKTMIRDSKRDGKITVAEVDALVATNPEVKKLKRRLITVEGIAGKLKTYREGFSQRAFMLHSKGNNRRAEGPMTILEDNVRKTTKRSRNKE